MSALQPWDYDVARQVTCHCLHSCLFFLTHSLHTSSPCMCAVCASPWVCTRQCTLHSLASVQSIFACFLKQLIMRSHVAWSSEHVPVYLCGSRLEWIVALKSTAVCFQCAGTSGSFRYARYWEPSPLMCMTSPVREMDMCFKFFLTCLRGPCALQPQVCRSYTCVVTPLLTLAQTLSAATTPYTQPPLPFTLISKEILSSSDSLYFMHEDASCSSLASRTLWSPLQQLWSHYFNLSFPPALFSPFVSLTCPSRFLSIFYFWHCCCCKCDRT